MNKLMQEFTKSQLVTFSICLVIVITGLSYAYFSAVLNNKNVTNTVVVTGNMRIEYDEGQNISFKGNMVPGDHFDKTFTVENTGDVEAVYSIYLNEVFNDFEDKSDLVYELITEDGENVLETVCPSEDSQIASGIVLGVGQTHHYTLRITFLETNDNQDDNTSKTFSAKIDLEKRYLTADVYGDIDTGAKVKIGKEEFYIIKQTEDKLTLLTKYALEVGNDVVWQEIEGTNEWAPTITPIANPSGIQSASVGENMSDSSMHGGVSFSNSVFWADNCENEGDSCLLKAEYGDNYPAYAYDSNTNVKGYIDSYVEYLRNLGVDSTGRLLDVSDFQAMGCDVSNGVDCSNSNNANWISSVGYYLTGIVIGGYVGYMDGTSVESYAPNNPMYVLRPVIEIEKDKVTYKGEEGVFAYIYSEQNAISYAESDLYALFKAENQGSFTQSECNNTLNEAISNNYCTNSTCYCSFRETASQDYYHLANTHGSYDTLELCNSNKWGNSTCIQGNNKYHIRYFEESNLTQSSCQSKVDEYTTNGWCGEGGCSCVKQVDQGTDIYDIYTLELSRSMGSYYDTLVKCQTSEDYANEEHPVCQKVYSKGDKYVEYGLQDKYVDVGYTVNYGYIPVGGKTLVLRRTKNGDEEKCTKTNGGYDCTNAGEIDGRTLVAYYGNIEDVDMCGYDGNNCSINPLWRNYASDIRRISIEEKIYPTNTSDWFTNTKFRSLNLNNKMDTSYVYDMARMFKNTNGTIDLGNNFKTSNVRDMTSMFEGALDGWGGATIVARRSGNTSNINGINLGPYFDTSNVYSFEKMFAYIATYNGSCRYDSTVDLGTKFSVQSANSLTGMFESFTTGNDPYSGVCSGSVTINLPNSFNTKYISYMDNMFSNAAGSAKNVTINFGSNFDTSNVISTEYMFSMFALRADSITLDFGPKFNPNNIRYYDMMFSRIGMENSYRNYKFTPEQLKIYVPASAQNWIIARGLEVNNTYNINYFDTSTIIAKY